MAGLTLRDEIALSIEAGFGDDYDRTVTHDNKTEVFTKQHEAPIVVFADSLGFPGWVSLELRSMIVADVAAILALDQVNATLGGQQ